MDLKKVKFPKGMDTSFIDKLRARVRDYFDEQQISRYGNASMVWKSIFMISLYFVPYGIMVSGLIQDLWMLLIGWILMGFGMAGIGLSIMHDANHRSYSSNQASNKFITLLEDSLQTGRYSTIPCIMDLRILMVMMKISIRVMYCAYLLQNQGIAYTGTSIFMPGFYMD